MTIYKYSYKTSRGVKARWGVSFIIDGIRYQKRGFSRRSQAAEAERQMRYQAALPFPKQITTFETLVESYLENSKAYDSRLWFQDKVNRIYGKFMPALQVCDITTISTDQIRKIILDVAARATNITANKDLSVISSVFKYAVDSDLLERNPCRKIPRLPEQHKRKYVPSVEDVNRVLMVLNQERRDQLQVIMGTVARSVEIMARLKWDDVDFKKRTVTLWTRKTKRGDTRGQVKKMTDNVFEILSRHYKVKTSDYVFVNQNTGKRYSRCFWLAAACRQAGIRPFGLHSLRHLQASRLDAQGVPLRKIQNYLGHMASRTTDTYLHDIAEDRKALEVLDSVTTGVTTGDTKDA